MQLFNSATEYLIAFWLLAFIAFCTLFVLFFPDWATLAAANDTELMTYLNVLVTVIFAIYLVFAWRKTSNRVERTAIGLIETDCVASLSRCLYLFGVPWAGIPYDHIVNAVLLCTAATFAGVRTLEVTRLEKAR